jgi:hypothetical protein
MGQLDTMRAKPNPPDSRDVRSSVEEMDGSPLALR